MFLYLPWEILWGLTVLPLQTDHTYCDMYLVTFVCQLFCLSEGKTSSWIHKEHSGQCFIHHILNVVFTFRFFSLQRFQPCDRVQYIQTQVVRNPQEIHCLTTGTITSFSSSGHHHFLIPLLYTPLFLFFFSSSSSWYFLLLFSPFIITIAIRPIALLMLFFL